MLFIALSALVVLATTTLSALHLRGLSRAISSETESLVLRLKRRAAEDRVRIVVETAAPSSWERRFAEELEAAPSPELKAAAANEALGDLALLFSSRARWSPSAVRICLLGGLLFGALALIRGERLEAILSVGVCAIGAGVCTSFASRARRLETAQRKVADDLAEALVPGVPRTESVGRRFRNVW